MVTRPAITVVVPTRDRPEQLAEALAALQRGTDPVDTVIVVDSASSDPAAIATIVGASNAMLIRSDVPGASLARNLGWRAATTDVVGFVDDDVRVKPGWAAAIARCFEAHPETAFVTGRIDAGVTDMTMTVAVKDDVVAAVYDDRDGGVIGHSASLAVRRSALETVGGFDEALGAGGRFKAAEDTDIFDRLLGGGLPGRYEPAADATHDQWRRIRQWVVLQHSYGIGGGARLAKLLRADRRRLRVAMHDDLWTWGLGRLPGELIRRDGYRALGTLLRLLGVARGFAVGVVTPVHDGHFRSRSNSS